MCMNKDLMMHVKYKIIAAASINKWSYTNITYTIKIQACRLVPMEVLCHQSRSI